MASLWWRESEGASGEHAGHLGAHYCAYHYYPCFRSPPTVVLEITEVSSTIRFMP